MTITSTLVNHGLSTVRLPLTVTERALGSRARGGDWPPARAFDAFGATVRRVVGSLAHDEDLADDGRLQQARIGQLRRGDEFETLATTLEAEADAELARRLEADAARRRAVDERTATRKRRADELAQEEAERESARLTREAEAAAAANADAAAVAARRERAARSKRLRAERDAIAQEERVVATEREVERIDAELTAAQAARKAR